MAGPRRPGGPVARVPPNLMRPGRGKFPRARATPARRVSGPAGTPGGTRTRTGALLRRLPLPLGYGPTLILQGHIDVVPAGDLAAWEADPFEPRIVPRGGRDLLVARGSCDMKAGLVAALAALAAMRAAGVRTAGGVTLHSVAGEE